MKFFARRRRTAPAVIIIALIDVLIVMLVFLMVSTTFRNAPSVKVTLPESTGEPTPGAGQQLPPLELWISTNQAYFLGPQEVTAEQVFAAMRDAATNSPQQRLLIRADRQARWEQIFRVLDFARQVRLTNVQAYTQRAAAGE